MYDFKADNKQPVIYDCGANIGVSALYYKILYPGSIIKAFEADSNIAGILKSNLTVNNIQGVDVINKAAWINNDGVTFNVDNADGGSVYGEGNKITVDSIRLRDLIASEEILKEQNWMLFLIVKMFFLKQKIFTSNTILSGTLNRNWIMFCIR
jgi:FkbM family methyltransferase